MIQLPEREQILQWVDEAQQAGARLEAICDQLVISARTLQRWRQGEQVPDDGRITRVCANPSSAPPVPRADRVSPARPRMP